MTPTKNLLGLSALLIGSALGATQLHAQNATAAPAAVTQGQADPAHASMNPDDAGTYATGKPLDTQPKEGFWGHLNPFARKHWVNRQVDPVKDRVNELDQLQAKNANDIRDVDSRATAGIDNAMTAANTADRHAMDANNRANAANTLASDASDRETSLNGTVHGLDRYQPVTSASVPFATGRTTLGPKAKSELDELTTTIASEKGYIVEVQGYSKSGVQTSQAMADSVVRYLVEHDVPVYRIYKTGLGHVAASKQVAGAEGEKPIANGVRVTLLHNSLATMDSASPPTSSSARLDLAPAI